MGLYQLRFLERIPARAAVNESVELVKRARKTSAASLVNAVLRRAAAEAAESPARNSFRRISRSAERLSILHSHPAWMVERWLARFGEAANDRAARSQQPHAALELARCSDRLSARNLPANSSSAGLQVEPWPLLHDALCREWRQRHRAPPRFARENLDSRRSVASHSAAARRSRRRSRARPVRRARRKDASARACRRNRGVVVAADRYAHRLRAMAAQFARLGLRTCALCSSMRPKLCLSARDSIASWSTPRVPAPARWRATRKFAGGCARSNWQNFTPCRSNPPRRPCASRARRPARLLDLLARAGGKRGRDRRDFARCEWRLRACLAAK